MSETERIGIDLYGIAALLEAHAEVAEDNNRKIARNDLRDMAYRCRAIADVAARLDAARA